MEQVSLPLWVDEAWSCRHIAPNRRGLAFRASYLDESRSTEYLPNLYLCRDIVPCHFSCRRNRYSNEDIFFCGFAIFASYLQCYQWLQCTLSQHNRLSPEPAKDANLCHSDASYKYKNCACAGVLSLFLQSYGRVRIHTGRLEQVVCWLQLLPYEAERRTAQRCQAARLRARYRPVTPRRPSSSSELLLHGSWRVRTCTCDCFVLRERHFSNRRVHKLVVLPRSVFQ